VLKGCLVVDEQDPDKIQIRGGDDKLISFPPKELQPFSSSEALTKGVEDDDAGIGFVGFAYRGAKVKVINIMEDCPRSNGLSGQFVANVDSIRSEGYPVSRRLYLYTRPDPRELAKSFIDFVEREGQKVISREGFVSLDPRIQTEHSMRGAGSADVVRTAATIKTALGRTPVELQRLTTTFHFDLFCSDLNTLGQQDIERLAEFLARPDNRDRKVFLLGFEDSVSTNTKGQKAPCFEGAISDIAFKRANLIKSLLQQAIKRRTDPYDADNLRALPGGRTYVACDDPVEGNGLNRRVEVWLGNWPSVR